MAELGRLTAIFDADTRKFDAGARGVSAKVNALERTMGDLSKTTLSTGGSVASLSSALPGLAGAATIAAAGIGSITVGAIAAGNAIFQLSKHTMEVGGHLYDLAQQTNFSVETLSALGNAAETSGGSLDSISASLGIFQKHLEEANTGTDKASRILKMWGIDLNDNEKALGQVTGRLSAMPEGVTQTAYALEIFGRSGKQMLAILKESDGDLERFKEQMRDAGLSISTDFAREADRAGDDLTRLQQKISILGAELGAEFLPLVDRVVSNLTTLLRENKEEIKEWAKALSTAISYAPQFADGMHLAARALNPFLNQLLIVRDSLQKTYDLMMRVANIGNPMFGATGGAGGVTPPDIGVDVTYSLPGPATPGARGGGGRGSAGRDPALDKLREQLRDVADKAREAERELAALKREEQRLADVAMDVSEAIFEQNQAISDLTVGYPTWLRQTYDFIVAKAKEGYVWDENTKQIYLNNAARLEQLRILSEGATRARQVFELSSGTETRPRFATDERSRERLETIRKQTEALASDLMDIFDRALYDGIAGGGMRGLQSLTLGFLQMIQEVIMGQLKKALAEALGGVATKGGGGWLSKVLGAVLGIGTAAAGGGGGSNLATGAGAGPWGAGWFAKGGIVPGVDTGRDTFPAMLTPGEMVLTKGQQKHLASKISSNSTTVNHFNFTVQEKRSTFRQNRSKRELAEMVAGLLAT